MILDLSREDLFNMDTNQLFALNAELTDFQSRVEAELKARGEW